MAGHSKPKEKSMNEEDQLIKQQLDSLMDKLQESDFSYHKATLESMRDVIKAATTSITAVPKPLKLMMSHYERLTEIHQEIGDEQTKRLCAEILSAVAMTRPDTRDCLHYRLQGLRGPVGEWGHEYVRHLTSQVGQEWLDTDPMDNARLSVLLDVCRSIVEYDMNHGCEAEACDLLMEIDSVSVLPDFVKHKAHQDKVCRYLLSCAYYAENEGLLKTTQRLFYKFGNEIDALRCAMMALDMDEIKRIFFRSSNSLVQYQMALLLARHHMFLDIPDNLPHADTLKELHSNCPLHEHLNALAKELDIAEPKTLKDVYRCPSMPIGYGAGRGRKTDKLNIAGSFANGFANTGYGTDSLITAPHMQKDKWFFENHGYGRFTAAASQGLLLRWNIEGGLAQCEQYLYSRDENIKGGTLLALAIILSGIKNEFEMAETILVDYVGPEVDKRCRTGAIFGLGLAYTNSERGIVVERVIPKLVKVLSEKSVDHEIQGLAGLSLGLICVGKGDGEVAEALRDTLLEQSEESLKRNRHLKFIALGLGLVYLSIQDQADEMIQHLGSIPEPFRGMVQTLVGSCAYAGTGDVLKVQELLQICAEYREPDSRAEKLKKEESRRINRDAPSVEASMVFASGSDSKATLQLSVSSESTISQPGEHSQLDRTFEQGVAVLGIALVAMGEELGENMCIRTMGHLMRCGDIAVKRRVPLALGLISVSNPQLSIIETLSKLSHDYDQETAYNAIFALGLVGAGTNNARLNTILHQLADFYTRKMDFLMLVKIAQGMLHMGKGTMTLNPFHSDRQLMSASAVAGILITSFSFLDVERTILGPKQHYLLYSLVPAIQPRILMTFLVDDDKREGTMEEIHVLVRVGQAVDVVGQAGTPKKISGFQTHTTPVLLAYGERAELANDEYFSMTPHLEGLVILKKNPEFVESVREWAK